MTYFQAAVTILRYADRPLTVGELTSVAIANGLIHPRGRTPDRTMSSVLYRRMVADPDAPVSASAGRFWLRGRRLAAEGMTLRPAVRRVRRAGGGSRLRAAGHGLRPASRLPDPIAIALPSEVLATAALPAHRAGRRTQRHIERLRRFGVERALASAQTDGWDAERTFLKAVAPLLTQLGYRRRDQSPAPSARGRAARLLRAGEGAVILLDVVRAGHEIGDDDARVTLARGRAAGVQWVLVTNGRSVRAYAPSLAHAQADPAAALVLRVDLADLRTGDDAAHLLWLLGRSSIAAGALDAYLASRAVGIALLRALDDPSSPLVSAMVSAVQSSTGLKLTAAAVARHARLAVRTARGRDGEPLPVDVEAVAAAAVPAVQQYPALDRVS